jgi:hypothetical protein
MLGRIFSNGAIAVEVSSAIYKNSRIVVYKDSSSTTLPYEVRIDFARITVRFKELTTAVHYAVEYIDETRAEASPEVSRLLLA